MIFEVVFGTRLSSGFRRNSSIHHVSDLLPSLLEKIGLRLKDRPDQILEAWPSIIGTRLASQTKAISFSEGILHVKVFNSTLLSLLNGPEKALLVKKLRLQFPGIRIEGIALKLG